MQPPLDATRAFGLSEDECRQALSDAQARRARRPADGAQKDHTADVLLAAAYRKGTPEAVQVFRERFAGMIRFVTRQCLTPADALEAEDESWASLWEKLSQYEGRSSLGTWLYVVVRRWCWRRSQQKPPPGPDWTDEEGMGMEERVAAPDPEVSETVACRAFGAALDECTVEALRGLSAQERALLRLRYVHQMPLEQLRMRPEIYGAGEPPQPVYGITRRVQRAGKKVREAAVGMLLERGYEQGDCERLLHECEGMEVALARKLIAELSTDHH
ncbi:MAG: sigma-70 family RNA polymerase sigma factor [Armatimonadetes bacterium]|nr:sigma-70 family RNA polymerase sigma factor [Armatimonadota bacterium]